MCHCETFKQHRLGREVRRGDSIHSDAKKVWAYGLRTKCIEVVLKCMKDFVEVQLTADGLRLRIYHADGAGELVGLHIRKYLRGNKSTRTVKEMALALLLDSGLPSVFWFIYLYLINELPTKTSKGYISPVEFFTGNAPNASKLKIWGCKAWAIVPKEQRRKEWKEKGNPGNYMGVSEWPMGHQIYIPDLD